MIATASCRSPHRCELHHPARLQRSNPHRACRAITAHHARFPPLEAFGRRPHQYAAPPIMRPASETLHKRRPDGPETPLPLLPLATELRTSREVRFAPKAEVVDASRATKKPPE